LVNDVKHETDARHAHVPLPDPPQPISHKISPQQTLLSQVKEAFAHGLSFYGSALTSELDIRSELSKTSTSLELTIRSHRTKGRQWSRDCSLDSSARLSATSTDVEKAGLLDKPEDVDLLRQVNFAALENALDGSVAKYRAEHYHDARLGFLNVISKVHNLPPSLRGYYNTFGIAYMHAVAAYHSTDYINARHVLMDFVSKQARTRTQKLCLAHASSLLAFVSIELGELQAARVACTQAVQCCYGMDSRSAKALDDYLALSARVETLLGNHARAKELICGTEPGRQDLLTRLCSRSPHRQSLSLEERCAIARSETDLFAKAEFCEHTGRVTALASQGHNCGGRLFMRSLGRRSKPQNIGITSLHFAVLFGDAEEASALIDNGADVDAQANVATFRHLQWSTEHPFTPLACALLLRHANLVRLLVSKGAKLTNPGGTSVVLAIMNEKFVRDDSHSFREILDTLKLLGWDINSPSGPKGRTLLHNAVRSSNSKHARILVSCGASVTTKDLHGNIPLNIAIARWRHESRVPEMISTLLRHHKQEQLTSRNHSGMTPLHVVTHSDHLLERAALFLLKAGADPHAIDDLGRIPYNWLQKRWDWTGVSRFLTNSRSEMPSVASFDSPGMMAEHTEAAGRFLDAIT
jgi:ankyrin repeat protein